MTSLDGDDEAPIVDDSAGSTKKFTLTQVKEWLQALVGWISTAMLADDSVTTEKILDLEVTPEKIGTAYSVRVTKSANGSFANGAVITFNTEAWKTEASMHDNSTNSNRLVAPIDGYYQVNAVISSLNGETGGERLYGLRVNGTSLETLWNVYNASYFNFTHGSLVVKLNAGDYVDVANTSGVTVTVRGGAGISYLDMTFVGGL